MIVVDLFLSRMKIELKTSNILLPYHTSFFSSQIRFLSWNLVIPIPTETEYVEVEGVVQKLSAIWYSSKDLKVFSGSSRKNEKNKTVFVMFSSCGLIGPCDLWQQHFCDTHVLISFEQSKVFWAPESQRLHQWSSLWGERRQRQAVCSWWREPQCRWRPIQATCLLYYLKGTWPSFSEP